MPVVLANIFQPLIDVFEQVLLFFHKTVGAGWGLSIVLLTLLIRAALIPLTLRQFRSMQGLQRLQPQMKALQAKYKDDKQRLNQEMMTFYRENKVNPLGSCLPLAFQMPVFVGLFYMLRKDLRHNICPQINPLHAVHTRPCGAHNGAEFLFIPDLTNKATGIVLIVLIVLYVGSQLASSLLMSVTADKTQRNIMLFLPLIFVSFIISFPSGLIVYWITTNVWTIVQQYIVRKRVGPMVPAASPGGTGATEGAKEPPSLSKVLGMLGGSRGEAGNGDAPSGAAVSGATGEVATRAPAPATAGARRVGAAPPPPPRKKKKRSGRRQ